ncbi:hypothetical protein ABQX22_25070 [Xanthomonas sp. WHRI 1810A]|uniref:hypothetical protein n=1 Tax=Xanthomonas sp. WHRI 1810A TaxID=3161565 RepID=UPI0032E8CD69
MTKPVTSAEIKAIEDFLYSWEGPVTWDCVCTRAQSLIGKVLTRQTLGANPAVRKAFDYAKLRNKDLPAKPPAPSSLKIAGDRISRLEAELAATKSENSRLIEQFLRWQYNASIKGLSEQHLNKPLPIIDRERSDAPLRDRLKGLKKLK